VVFEDVKSTDYCMRKKGILWYINYVIDLKICEKHLGILTLLPLK
jgi:hypothetical protein